MPTFTTNIQKQVEASTAAFGESPQVPNFTINKKFNEEYDRADLNPTNNSVLYETSSNGTNALVDIDSASSRSRVRAGNTGDAFEKFEALFFNRTSTVDDRSIVTWKTRFGVSSVAAFKMFIGFLRTDKTLTAIPTTSEPSLGLTFDSVTDTNWMFIEMRGLA